MSSTNKTAELHLSQFIGTDIPSILTDYNGDMQKIDAGVREVKQATAGAVSDLSSVTARVTNAEQDISGLNSTVQGIATRVVTAEGEIDTLQSNVSQVQGSVSQIAEVIPSNASPSNKLATMADIDSATVQQLQNDVNDIKDLIPNDASANNPLLDYDTFSNLEGGICSEKFEAYNQGSTLLNLQNAWQQFKAFCDNNGISYGNATALRNLLVNTVIAVDGIMLRFTESFDGTNYNPEFHGIKTNGHGFYCYILNITWGTNGITGCNLYRTDVNVNTPESSSRSEISEENSIVIYSSMRPFVPSKIYS